MEDRAAEAAPARRREQAVFLPQACREDEVHRQPGAQGRVRGIRVDASLAAGHDRQAGRGAQLAPEARLLRAALRPHHQTVATSSVCSAVPMTPS